MMNGKPVIIVAAMDRKRGIGYKGQLPWRKMPADFRRFRELTIDNPVVVGRKTFESYGSKPLPRRSHFVVSRRSDYQPPDVVSAGSVESAIRMASFAECHHVSVIGGSEIFREALDRGFIDRMYLTRIESEFDADVFFPEFQEDDWELDSEDYFPKDGDPHACTVFGYVRRENMS